MLSCVARFAKIVIAIFEARGPVLGERIFNAAADVKAGPRVGKSEIGATPSRITMFKFRKCDAADGVNQDLIEAVAETAVDGREPTLPRLDGIAK